MISDAENPFLAVAERAVWNPGTLEMALPVVQRTGIQPGMRVLEIGGGSGQVACILAKHWNVTVVTLEPWHGGADIDARARAEGVWDRVLPLKLEVQHLPFARDSFDAVIAFGAMEMIGKDRPIALEQIKRVLRPGGFFGIGEAMNRSVEKPAYMEFDTLEQNKALLKHHGFEITHAAYFEDGYEMWLENLKGWKDVSAQERDKIVSDGGRSIANGILIGRKPTGQESSDSRSEG
jgi:cyclopropane fatty-acyl-phospholipid synthase-like methyltransferase